LKTDTAASFNFTLDIIRETTCRNTCPPSRIRKETRGQTGRIVVVSVKVLVQSQS